MRENGRKINETTETGGRKRGSRTSNTSSCRGREERIITLLEGFFFFLLLLLLLLLLLAKNTVLQAIDGNCCQTLRFNHFFRYHTINKTVNYKKKKHNCAFYYLMSFLLYDELITCSIKLHP